ncbi:TPA: hypothetical protein DCZ46_02270 [Candidatus Campbellbacteria bacterium]|uniref:Uncharacterized protein n=1 Tax=Candidatus Nomurabacteria bacterium GW2011_GWC2_42_20 TaxID=1618756 RepID=A0A0G1CFJ4_9BACT|nr:MAG: hypothetical protein UU88_C0003G0013 [Parcubacteria group bacterium GW2011_GWC1_42_11]KKS48348.1 MAG: hypothetical protein UV12_C0001G0043 [Candidatus Nomurabacteria bacterium GW2011_GWC2_42_20]KKS59016.1 MAG: hypothetical protein UV24_C0009G0007 [Candidatus Nomurabacteria bacterium GW2011_GWA2_42_41]KKT09924.1 MAG: hypothetical protein UV86_C0001G0026 [Candidatus Nomurabacteria bacterium GW2011_GWB1_43_20]TAN35578.1 MAG: hypothetical protein EPN27_03420 [Patescibacteria group bacterium
MIKKYIEYYRDNPEELWFKRKLFGWGWVPVRWQGWFTLAVYLVVMTPSLIKIDTYSNTNDEGIIMPATIFIIATTALIYACYKKGEKPKWQWGLPKKK